MCAMRIAIAALVASVSSAALAASLPIQPGSRYCDGDTVFSMEGVVGPSFTCSAIAPATKTGAVLLLCENNQPLDGPPWTDAVAIIEDSESLTYVGHDGPTAIERCE